MGATLQNLCLLYMPALNAMMADSVPPEKRGMRILRTKLDNECFHNPQNLLLNFIAKFKLILD